MSDIKRYEINEEWAHAGMVEAGGFIYVSYCVGNIGKSIEDQVNGAFDHLEKRLLSLGLDLNAVIKLDCLFRDIWHIPILEKVLKERFQGNYPARKSVQTEFAHRGGSEGLLFQLDAVCYRQQL